MSKMLNDSQTASPATSLSYEEMKRQIQEMLPAPVAFSDDQNLIELGLDSLQMMRMVNKWRKEGAKVTFAELIGAPTLRDWQALLQKKSPSLPTVEAKTADVEVDVPFPLTDVQYAYWIGRQDDQPLGGVGCHAYLEIDGVGVEPDRLEAAWGKLLMHHPMLRARFLTDGQQEVMSTPTVTAVPIHDLRAFSEIELARELDRIRDRMSHRRLAVEAGEVAGLELSLLPEGRTRIHFDLDLLVADVQSLHIVLRDLTAAYARGIQPVAPANWSFAHYLRQEAQRRAQDRQEAARYWQERLSTLPQAPGLPLKEKPEMIKSPVFARRTHFMKAVDWTLLQKRSAAQRVTPAMVLLTAYAEVLARWSTHLQFLINIPLFDRQTGDAGIEDVVADFTNLLLLAVDMRDEPSFLARVRSIQSQFHQDVAHAAYSGVQLQRDLARVRQGERDFAPVVFACNLGTPLINDECRETLGKLTYMISQTPQVWLDFQSYEMDGGLLLAWDAVDQLFPDGMIDQMFAAFCQLMDSLVTEDSDWQVEPALLPDMAKQRNDQVKDDPQLLHRAFFAYAQENPHETALIDSRASATFSYGELARYALQIAALLQKQGVEAGDPVAVSLPRGIDQVAAVLGIVARGACYVPVGIGQPATRRERIHSKAGIRYVLTDTELAQTLEWPEDAVVLAVADALNVPPLAEPVAIPTDSLAYIIFTSGSTGEPKGVEISHSGAWNTISEINRRYGIGPADRILAVSSLDFDLSVYDLFGLLSVGGSIVLISEELRRDAAHWAKLVDQHQITLWNSVPVLLDMLFIAAESGQYESLPLRVTMLSGDWIGLDLPQRLNQLAPNSQLVAMGGATEASIWSNFFDVTLPLPAHWTSIPYGRPLANQAYRVVDAHGRDCPDWVAGELWIGGAGVAVGYRGDPALTAERFGYWNGSRWYRTGDLGRYWPDGTIEFLGRKDFQVKIRGHRIELGEIESAMKQHPGIRDAVVTAVGNPRENRQLVGYVVPNWESESALFDSIGADQKKSEALWAAVIDKGREHALAVHSANISPEEFPFFWAYMEGLAARYICRALKKAGVSFEQSASYSLDELMEHCGIQRRYRALIRQWLHTLADEGFVHMDESDSYSVMRAIPAQWLEKPQLSQALPAQEQQAQELLRYMEQVDDASVALLRGELDPLAHFFSEELALTPNDLMQTLPGAKQRDSVALSMVERHVHSLRDRSELEPIRVLEIGARSGALTESLLAVLPAAATHYTCTDTSTFFTNAAKTRFHAYPFVEYQLLDINQNPQTQGFEAHQYDVIIASDSLHRAKNIGVALSHVQSLLAPGGMLILLEMTRNSRLQQISTGFLEDGFTHFEDERLTKQRPLLSAEAWQQALQEQAFEQMVAFPEPNDSANAFGQHVIVAQASLQVKRFNSLQLSGFLSQKLPDYMVPTAFLLLNELPLSANGKVDRQALPTPDSLMRAKAEKAYTAPATPIETALAAIWCQLFDVERVGVTDNYFELGGDSLLATRLSALVRSKLGVELSLGRIFEKPTIAGLAQHVQMLMEQTEAASGLPAIVLAPQDRHQPFPLTDIQQAYWVGRSGVYALGHVSTHCYFEIEGQHLDLERVNRAWQRLIDQHEMMRAVILPDGWRQQILEQVPAYRIEVTDLRNSTAEEARAELQAIREEMSHQVLSTDVWPLFDVRASCFGEERVRLHISFDNLIFDGWSMFHLLSEWTRLYHEPDASLAPLDLSFRDYVLAQEELKSTELYQRDLDYWMSRLPDLPPAPQLPLAKNPDTITEQRFSRLEARLNRQAWQQLKKRTAEVGLTPSGILLTAYAETLGAWSKSSRFTINLTQFNRLPLHAQVNEIVGDFTTLTLLAVELSAGETILERGRNLQQQLWRDLDHPYVGGVQVQRELAKQTGEHNGVAMPVVFTSALGVEQWSGSDADGKWLGKLVYNITQTPQVWLDHQVVEQDGELLLIWDAVEGLFPEGLLADMFSAYCDLLHRLTDDETVWQKSAPSLIAVPRLEARVAANNTAAPASSETLVGLFAKQAASNKDHPAVISAKRTLTYGELSDAADEIAEWLRSKGVQPNTLVAVVMEKGWEQVAATLGIMKSGAAYLPIDPAHPEERRSQLLHDGQVQIVLTQSWTDERLGWPASVERLIVDQMTARNEQIASRSVPALAGQPEDLAYVIYTSGSTGLPKGVMIDHRGVVNTIEDVNQRFAVGPSDRVLALSNLNFDLSVYDIFGMLAAGGTIVMPDADKAKDPAHWLEWLEAEQVTVWNTVPALMQMLIEYAAGRNLQLPHSLRLVLLSGDWIPLDLPDKIKAYFPHVQVIGLGGATEASIWSNFFVIQDIDPSWKSIPYGRPMVNQRYHVLSEWMGDCPVWVPGQLYISGTGLAKGYWNDESKTNEKFITHPRTGERLYRTGDLGRYLPDGTLEFLGREDFQVKIRGHRIELGEIEMALKRQDGVKDAVVAVPDDGADEKRLVGYVVLDRHKESALFETEQADPAHCSARWQAINSMGQSQADTIPAAVEVEPVTQFLAEADRVSTAYMCSTLAHMGMFSQVGESSSITELMHRFQIHPRYQTLLVHWLEVLVAEGLLEKQAEGKYRSLRSLREGAPDTVLSASPLRTESGRELEAVFRRDYPLFIGLLTGELDPLELFLADDTFLTPAGLNRFDLTREFYKGLAGGVFDSIVSSHPSDKTLRVLEVGTRAGSLTQTLVSTLPAERGRYLYVDESSFFTDRAKKEWGEQAPLEYGQLDMNAAPLAQGYEPHSFDVIVADNTLHRSRHIDKTMSYLKGLLAPGGLLFLVESTRNSRLLLTTVGFFEDGFSHLEDERKAHHLPLFSVEQWRAGLENQGFTNVLAYPQNGQAAEAFDRHLIVAQAPESVRLFQPEKMSEALRHSLPDYMVPTEYVLLDELPLSANGKVDRKALAKLGGRKTSTPKKAHVAPTSEMEVKLASVWEEVLGVSEIGIHDNFFSRGGDSLRAIQCLNLLKERYEIDLSLQNLFEASTICTLAELIKESMQETEHLAGDYDEGTI
ncbi:amino acid adenylation domain-containing protein [Brevibacillus sp. 179-C9.3 HS]|uniref:amino acid adenylation domain-containing protein n=1 Tax=unclassified Brevibacillus TaxID=2684853 RepID=UPI00399EF5C2